MIFRRFSYHYGFLWRDGKIRGMDFSRMYAEIKHFDHLPLPDDPLVARTRLEQRNSKGAQFYRFHDGRPEKLPAVFHCEHPSCGHQLSFDPQSYLAVKRIQEFEPGWWKVVSIEDHGLCPDGHVNHIFNEDDLECLQYDGHFNVFVRIENVVEMDVDEVRTAESRLQAIGELTIQALQQW